MPPKKPAAPEVKPLIGRVGTNLKIGIVGLPNVGKSTFFNVLTKSQAQAENFPFCTIDPNESRVPVPDERWQFLCEYHKPARIERGKELDCKVPAFLNVTDIAGLVKGASEGQGLGNAFLSHIKACDALFHLMRAFDDGDVTHVEGDVNPVRDLEIIANELRLKDIECVNAAYDKIAKLVERGDKKLKAEYDVLVKVKDLLENKQQHIRFADWDGKEIIELNKHLLITSKPLIYLINLSEKDYIRKKNKWLPKIKEWVDANDPGALIIPFSGVLENKLLEMGEEERAEYCKANNCTRYF
ncbi:hypothetical protein HAZT_HAZT007466 [Hyalella azteca]|uniref:OBG-type G domain-containing protein n=1 Tax=Hyalella azteca TaxID=294128 RepID=A0A6A0H4N6_HYAAZ|nr:hypothetical protein HAZT_HAZT007466 [Hyalella azteca]